MLPTTRRVLVISVVTLCIGAAALSIVAKQWSHLDQPIGVERQIDVPKGISLKAYLGQLETEAVIPSALFLYTYARLHEHELIQAGEYQVRPSQSPKDVLEMLARGSVITYAVTIPEGLDRWQMASRLEREQLVPRQEFDALCDDASLLAGLEIPGPSCEGYLFPDTYHFAKGVSPTTVFSTLVGNYKKHYAQASSAGTGPLGLSERELVTLASIVEKETGATLERSRIACVFYNRLRAQPPWRLGTDPTVIYAARLSDPTFTGNLTRHHLYEMEHPYNTYLQKGLPPGPIANPGLAAMQAVAAPEDCPYFFFVSMNNGQHEFCADARCHDRAVQKWQVDFFRARRKKARLR